jgi:hypothetical protein
MMDKRSDHILGIRGFMTKRWKRIGVAGCLAGYQGQKSAASTSTEFNQVNCSHTQAGPGIPEKSS